MKAISVILLLLTLAWCDDLPEGSTIYVRDIYLVNTAQFSKYIFIDSLRSLIYNESYNKLVEDNVSLKHHMGSMPATKYFFVVKKSYFDEHGGLDGIDFNALEERHPEMKAPFPEAGDVIVDGNCSVKKDAYYYEIESFNDTNMTFKLQQRVLTDNEGKTEVIRY